MYKPDPNGVYVRDGERMKRLRANAEVEPGTQRYTLVGPEGIEKRR